MLRPTSVPIASIDTSQSLTLQRRDRLWELLDGYDPLRAIFPGEILKYPMDGVSAAQGVRAALWCPRRNAAAATAGGTSVTMPYLPEGARGETQLEIYLALTILVHASENDDMAASLKSYDVAAAVSDAFMLALITHTTDPGAPGLWYKLELLAQTTEFSRQEKGGPLRSDTYLRLYDQIRNP